MLRTLLWPAVAMLVAVAALQPAGTVRSTSEIDCDTYPYQAFAQAVLRIDPSDAQGLDGPDDDGIACSDLPCPCDTEAVEEAIGDAEADDQPDPTATSGSGAAASAGNVTANASASTDSPTATSPPGSLATVAVVPPTSTPFPAIQSVITPPSTGSGALK